MLDYRCEKITCYVYFFLKPSLRNKLETVSICLLYLVVPVSCILLSLHELYKSPHSCCLSPIFILFDLFLERQICCWLCLTHSAGLAQAACSLRIQTPRMARGIQRNGQPGFAKEWRSHTEQELLWSLSVCEIKLQLCFKRICCQFCLMSVLIQWGSNTSAVSILSGLGLIFHTEKGSNVGSSVHDREAKNIKKKPL